MMFKGVGLAAASVLAWTATVTACGPHELEDVSDAQALEPYPNPFGEDDPRWAPQPARLKPHTVVATRDGKLAFVSLPGTVDDPGEQIAVVDLEQRSVIDRIEVGRSPRGMALHPSGHLLVVANRFSNHLSVIDVDRREVVHSPEVPFYTNDVGFSPDGTRLYLSNRWHDSVTLWDVQRAGSGLAIARRDQPDIAVGESPHELAVHPERDLVAVASMTGLTVTLIDGEMGKRLHRLDVGAPANGVAFAGEYLLVATTSRSTHHYPHQGPDTNGNGMPGDGTPNINFQDLQNEIAVYRLSTGEQVHRYTSDTICCKDFRDVDPANDSVEGDLLPPSDRWIVAGALPEQIALDGDAVYVTYGGSNEIQAFQLDPDTGTLQPRHTWSSQGHNPRDVTVADGRLLVTHRLGETLGIYEPDGTAVSIVEVGDLSEGPFPATDVEIGELFNSVTAPFTVDGDQSCTHCHREGGNIAKAFSMPLTRYPGVGLRMTMAYRGAADTRPWFFESAMDETNFRPVMNEFARIENFCCSDYTLWPQGAPAGCTRDPPPQCDAPNPSSPDGVVPSRDTALQEFMHPRPTSAVTRDQFYLQRARRIIGRDRSFGDSLYFEDPITDERKPVALDFEGITRALGLFLLQSPRLLPNPRPKDAAAVRRGKALFESAETGCATCHPAPTFAVSTDVNPLNLPIVMGPVVTPNRGPDGINLDLFAQGFMEAFPRSSMETCEQVCGESSCSNDPDVCDDARNVMLGVPSLRGIWDRAAMFLHDGRAANLREVLATPGHPALRAGETGYNERDGVPDSHGATSHLSPAEIEDLIAYLLTL